MPKGLVFDADSVNLTDTALASYVKDTHFTVSSSGGALDTTLVAISLTPSALVLDETLTVTYDTTFTPEIIADSRNKIPFTNDAALLSTISASPAAGSDSAIVNIYKGVIVKKSASGDINYADDKYIKWTIDLNTAEVDLNVDTVTDTVDDITKHIMDQAKGLTVYPLTIAKYGNTISATPGEAITSYTLNYAADNSGFDLIFDDNITSAYRIVYYTKITDKLEDNFNNTVTIVGSAFPIIGGQGGSGINPGIANTFVKKSNGIDYRFNDSKTIVIEWIATLDLKEEKLTGIDIDGVLTPIIIEDNLSLSQIMSDTQFEGIVVNKGGTPLTKGTDYQISSKKNLDDKINGFIISFKDGSDNILNLEEDVYTIEYSTTVDPDVVTDSDGLVYDNTCDITATGFTSGDEFAISRTIAADRGTVSEDLLKYNGQKTVSGPVDQEMAWEIDVNYLSKNMQNLVVTDFIEGNHKLIEGSVEIYPITLDSDGNITTPDPMIDYLDIANGIEVTQASDVDEADWQTAGVKESKFSVTFNDPISQPYRITYKTEFEDLTQSSYSNRALLSYDDVASVSKTVTYTAETDDVDYADKYVYKSLESTDKATKTARWEILLNESQSNLDKLTITDILDPGLELDLSSLKLYDIEGIEMVDEFDDYFRVDDKGTDLDTLKRTFEFVSLQPITNTITIKYDTKVYPDRAQAEEIYNSVSFKGEASTIVNKEVSESVSFSDISAESFAVASAKREYGSFTVNKVDTKGNPLEGSEFTLYEGDPDGVNSEYYSFAVDAGTIQFTDVLYGDYYLKEITAPDGYTGDDSDIAFTIDSTDDVLIVVENSKKASSSGGGGGNTEPDPEIVPEPEVVPELEVESPPIDVTTPEETPTGGEIELPQDGTATIIDEPKNGEVLVDDEGNWTYTPDPGFVGKDDFSIKLVDGEGNEEIIYYEIDVQEIPTTVVELPKTSEASPWINYIIGFILIASGLIMTMKRKSNSY